jgi:hypothetical protein
MGQATCRNVLAVGEPCQLNGEDRDDDGEREQRHHWNPLAPYGLTHAFSGLGHPGDRPGRKSSWAAFLRAIRLAGADHLWAAQQLKHVTSS